MEQRPDQLRDAPVARCQAERIEPPTASRLERVATSPLATFEQAFCEQTVDRLSDGTRRS